MVPPTFLHRIAPIWLSVNLLQERATSEFCRQAFRRIASFEESLARPHFEATGFWEATVARWQREGLPEGVDASEYLGLDTFMDNSPRQLRPLIDSVCMPSFWPRFEIEVLDEAQDYRIIRDEDGAVKKLSKRNESVPQLLRSPVQTRQDWVGMRERLDPTSPGGYAGVEQAAELLLGHRQVLRFGVCGGFGFPRALLGMEGLSYAYYDAPELVHEIMGCWLRLYTGMADHLCTKIDFDYVFIWEDMAYKTGPLVSPGVFKEFMLPYLRDFIGHMSRSHAIEFFMVDFDGNNFDLMDLFTEAGVSIFLPCEVAASMEPMEVRKCYPGLALIGGIDKRALARGREAIKAEVMRKVPALLDSGGYFPSLDHHVPPDVSLDDFLYYIDLVRGIG